MSILEKITTSFQNKLPFVVYKKPQNNFLSAFFQKNTTLYYTSNYKERGFVFAPFNNENSAVLIPIEQSNFFKEKLVLEPIHFESEMHVMPDTSSAKKNHIKLVEKAISAINQNEFKKIVLSREEVVALSDFDLTKVYKKLLANNLNAMVYVWYHPKVGLWLGATPETLLSIDGDRFETMSLAGTQAFKGTTNVKWQSKEIKEQQFVTDYIIDNLHKITSNLNISKTTTAKAGNLLHLQTKINAAFKTNGFITNENKNELLIKTLHPTPAICGLPKEVTKQFILQNENYNRSFYTGFLGELNFEKPLGAINETYSTLFVNLRCMQIKEAKAFIYVGGGITKESNPEKEWLETVAKTQTLKRVL
ncbi:isochorismate synthase [Tenacibaculum sp. UWU-22]|uniref:isochorismate synthase n=1 Tax=Tenacibaculum sp. UWU-22 TaxID=3234187 RepID=UPI0034DAEC95